MSVRPSVSDGVDPPTFYTVNTSVYFSKSLAIGLPVSRTVAYPRRSDSVRVYWTCMIFFIFSTTLSEIEDEISKLKSGKSTGPVSVYQSRYPQTFEDCSPIKTT